MFFVLECTRESKQYRLHLDDEDGTSHIIGTKIPDVQRLFKRWGLDKRQTDDAIDAAREFGAVQCIPTQRRNINLFNRKPSASVKFEDRETQNAAACLR